MNNAKIISVDPGIKTLGELNINEITLSRLSRTISNPGQNKSSVKNFLNFIFGLNSQVNTQLSGKLLGIRIFAGAIIAALGLMTLQGLLPTGLSEMMAITACVFGASLLSGLFTRVVSFGAVAMSAISLYEGALAGAYDPTTLLIALTGLAGCVLGPGLYSTDMLLRRGIHKLYRNAHRYDPERDADKLSFDYNAFASVDDRLR